MTGQGKKKEQRKAKQAEKRAAKTANEETSSSSNNVVYLPADEWFSELQEKVLDCEPLGFVMDGLLRNTVRMTVELQAPRFGALPFLLGKNLVYTQLVVLDEDRTIQGKLYMTGSKVVPNDPNVIPSSRKLFKESVPYLLKNTAQWFFSRSLVFLFVAGDFDVEDGGLCSREAVKELLHELNSKEGISKLLGFDVVAASVVVSKEKLAELKDVHLNLTA